MMMQALNAGGLPVEFNKSREKMNSRFGDDQYKPNEGGFFEIPLQEYRKYDFPLDHEGKLIKVMCWGLQSLAVHEYRIVYMKRDPEEIRQSYEAFFGKPLEDNPFIKQYDERTNGLIEQLQNRKDVQSVHDFWYRDVLNNPRETIEQLSIWPLDTEKAIKAINPDKCRFKKEDLVEGI